MKKSLLLLSIITLLLSACSIENRIIQNNDPYKQVSISKLKQELPAYSDEQVQFLNIRDYLVNIRYVKKVLDDSISVSFDLSLTTGVRVDEMHDVIYLDIDDQIFELSSNRYKTKMYTQSSSSTSTTSSTTTETKENTDGSTSESESSESGELTSTDVSTTTTNSQDSYQLMNHDFNLPHHISSKIIHCRNFKLRIYVGNEAIDVPYKIRHLNKLKVFLSGQRNGFRSYR